MPPWGAGVVKCVYLSVLLCSELCIPDLEGTFRRKEGPYLFFIHKPGSFHATSFGQRIKYNHWISDAQSPWV